MLEKIMHEFPYKEALLFRDVRVERLKSDQERMDKERQEQIARQQAEERTSKIYIPPTHKR